ncbi:MAG: helix-turn-helix transcriptional regulator [Emcibacteraceae bacterium]|nr:helix-turn-helix transcriptional regulator [Emcibacteraceae bacterium]
MNKKTMSVTIIDAAKEVFHEKGYPVTVVEDIVNAAKISRGEFEDCFNSTEEVCLKVLKSYLKEQKNKFKQYDENDNTRQRLSMFLDAYYDDAESLAEKGCPIFNLYYDVRNMDNDLSEAVVEILEIQHEWIDEQFIIMLKSESAVDQGDRLMSAISGLLLLVKLMGDAKMFRNQIIQLRSWIRSM